MKTDSALSKAQDIALRGWEDGNACGSIAAFEWVLRRCVALNAPEIRDEVQRELDRRYPQPNPRRLL